jgi:hypothetical protein
VQSQTPDPSTFKIGVQYTFGNGIGLLIPAATTFNITDAAYSGMLTATGNRSTESMTLGGTGLQDEAVGAISPDCFMAEMGIMADTILIMLAARAAAAAACAKVPSECGFAQAIIYGAAIGFIDLLQKAIWDYCSHEQTADDSWGGGPDDPSDGSNNVYDDSSDGDTWIFYD